MAKSVMMLIAALVLFGHLATQYVSGIGTYLQPHSELVNASSLFACPECSHGDAGKYAAKHRPDGVDDYDPHQTPAHHLEPLRGEDALVLEEDRCLCQTQG